MIVAMDEQKRGSWEWMWTYAKDQNSESINVREKIGVKNSSVNWAEEKN